MKTPSAPGWLRWLGQVLSWLVILGVGAMLAVGLLIPRLAGATPYVIETGSMSPKLPPGSLIVVKPVSPDQIAPGDVITYQIKSGDPTVVTHRVIAQGLDMTGGARWRTQGDANDTADENWVLPQQVKGKKWYAVPYLGYVTSFVTNQQRGVIMAVVVLGLVGYAGAQFRGSLRDRRRKNGLPVDDTAPPEPNNPADVTP